MSLTGSVPVTYMIGRTLYLPTVCDPVARRISILLATEPSIGSIKGKEILPADKGWPDSLLFSLTGVRNRSHDLSVMSTLVFEPRTPGVEVRRVNL